MTDPGSSMHGIEIEPLALSDRGRIRQAEILTVLHAAAATRRTRRRTIRRGAVLALALAAGAIAMRLASPNPVPAPLPLATDTPREKPIERLPAPPDHTPPTQPAHTATVIIVTNASVQIAECTASPAPGSPSSPPTVCLLTDDQLLAALAETGEGYGLIRTDARVEVVRNAP